MKQFIKKIRNTSIQIWYARGKFDNYCVYYGTKESSKVPKDGLYFRFLLQLIDEVGKEKVYNDFVSVYNLVDSQIRKSVLKKIEEISNTYENTIFTEIIFTLLYATMVAEENKANTYFGKRIKRLGVHQIVWEEFSVEEAANFSRGKNKHQLEPIMESRGF